MPRAHKGPVHRRIDRHPPFRAPLKSKKPDFPMSRARREGMPQPRVYSLFLMLFTCLRMELNFRREVLF
jgi:hypothetical protein